MFNSIASNLDLAKSFKYTPSQLKSYLIKIEADIQKHAGEEMRLEDAAQKADLVNMYQSSFRILSLAIHSKASIIEKHIRIRNQYPRFTSRQNIIDAKDTLDTLIPVLLIMMFRLLGYANVGSSKNKASLDDFSLEYKKIIRKQ